MNTPPMAGYREVEHTADWELQAWAPDLPGLFEQAAQGMVALAGVQIQSEPRLARHFTLTAADPERLLVSFLAELLWLGEGEGLGFDSFDLSIQANTLDARVTGGVIIERTKEIKAVTYHHLAIRPTGSGLEVNIVFDV